MSESREKFKKAMSRISGTKYGKFIQNKFFKAFDAAVTNPYDVLGNTAKRFKQVQTIRFIMLMTHRNNSPYLNLALELARMRGLNEDYLELDQSAKIMAFISETISKSEFQEIGIFGDEHDEDVEYADLE